MKRQFSQRSFPLARMPKSSFLLVLALLVLGAMVVMKPATGMAATYAADNSTVFKNPERGFHNRYEIINDTTVNDYATPTNPSGGFDPDSVDRTFARAKAAGNTVIHSYIHLDKYTTTDTLPPALLNNLSSGLAAIRTAGLKIVLRPAYTWSAMPSVPEARIIGHIAQINAVISANSDVVLHLEAGYLGPWGEWHSSLYTDYTKQSEGEIRYRIAKKLLDTTPATLPIVIRYPMALKEILEIPTPAGSSPLTQTDRDRLGHHNDCFLYNEADRGTYDKVTWLGTFTVAQQKQYVFDMSTSYGGNKMMGGETCDGNGRNDAAAMTVQAEMAALNFTEINVDFWDGAINVWKAANLSASGSDPAETAFVRLSRKMGYRLRLVDATFPTSATAGGSFTFSANLINDGYSSIVRPRPIFLVLESGANRYNLQMSSVDVRKWVSGANSLAQQTVTLPSNMPAGTYKLALWLPDSASGLQSRPEYSIRLANTGTWDAASGYNVLSNAITISGGGGSTATSMPTYTRTPTPTLTPTPTSTPNGYAAYEAESGSNTLAGGAGVVSCSTCSGGNKVGNVGNNAGTLQFNSVNGAAAGNYTLTIYYINGDGAARNATINVNGGAGSNISFAPTGSWTAVGSLQTTISLNAGSSNTIKFSNTSGWAPDFDRITIALNGGGPTNTPGPTATRTNTPTNTSVPPTTPPPTTPPPTTPPPSGNLALNRPATGSASCNTNETPAKAVNGSVSGGNSDKFCSTATTKWLQVDLGSSRSVTQFVVKHAGAGGESASYNTRGFNIQTSTDNVNWSTAVTVTTNTANVSTHNVTARNARYVRLNITQPVQGTGGAARIYEFEVYGGGTPPPTTPPPTTPPPTTPASTNTPMGPTPTSAPGLLLDNFDGSPAWPGGNDLGQWAGANSFVNGSGVLSGGALVLQYNNTGTLDSNITQNLSAYTYLVFVIRGAAGGEQNHFRVNFAGVNQPFGTLSGDTITTTFKTIRINMVTAGMNRASPGPSLQLLFNLGGSGTVTIDEIRFE